eukprot:2060411-Amphidinium_carterae.1
MQCAGGGEEPDASSTQMASRTSAETHTRPSSFMIHHHHSVSSVGGWKRTHRQTVTVTVSVLVDTVATVGYASTVPYL